MFFQREMMTFQQEMMSVLEEMSISVSVLRVTKIVELCLLR